MRSDWKDFIALLIPVLGMLFLGSFSAGFGIFVDFVIFQLLLSDILWIFLYNFACTAAVQYCSFINHCCVLFIKLVLFLFAFIIIIII